jgi:hypothetical protein
MYDLYGNLHELEVPFAMCELLCLPQKIYLKFLIHVQNVHENKHESQGLLL